MIALNPSFLRVFIRINARMLFTQNRGPNYSTVRILLCVASLGLLIEEVVRIILRILCVASLGIMEKKCCDLTGLNFLFM